MPESPATKDGLQPRRNEGRNGSQSRRNENSCVSDGYPQSGNEIAVSAIDEKLEAAVHSMREWKKETVAC
jgi:hypothetical protein